MSSSEDLLEHCKSQLGEIVPISPNELEALKERIDYLRSDERKVPSPRDKVEAVGKIVEILEEFSDDGRKEILNISGTVLAPVFDYYDVAMRLLVASADASKKDAE